MTSELLKFGQGMRFCLQLFLLATLLGLCPAVMSASEASDDHSQKVAGRVVDVSGVPIVGVFVVEKNTSNGTMTDEKGNYELQVGRDAVLEFSFIGFQTQEQKALNRAKIDVTLKAAAENLDEVFVVGYGTQSREKLTASVSKLDNKALENVPYTHATAALQGGIPGLVVLGTSGQPGSSPRVVLRGGTSINNPDGSTPLYVVDGVIREELNDFPSQDIASMQVLKDAAATSIYGARASNGVILITTKSGRAGAPRVSVSYDFSISNEPRELEFVSAAEYITASRQSIMWSAVKNPDLLKKLDQAIGFGTGNDLSKNTAFTTQYLTEENKHKLDEGWESVTDPYDPTKQIIFKSTDFQKLRKQTAFSHNVHASASGGSDKATYSVSLGYIDGEGTALSSSYRRANVSANGSVQITPKLKVIGRMMYTNTKSLSPSTTSYYNTFTRSSALPSTAKCYFEDGSVAPGVNSTLGNPLYYQVGPYAQRRYYLTTSTTASVGFNWEIIKGLTFESQGSLYQTNEQFNYFQPAYLTSISTYNTMRPVTMRSTINRNWQANAILTYANSFGKHNLEAKLGYEYHSKDYWNVEAQGKGAATDNVPTLNASAEPRDVLGLEWRMVTEGMFGRVNYDYDGRYLFSANFRYDGASNLGANKRTGFFPGVSAGWNLHREPFWKGLMRDGLMNLKIRASYGVNGNIQGLSAYQAQGLYTAEGKYNEQASILPSVITNNNLAWEESRTFDVGFDLSMFNRRVNVIFDYYDRITDNLLTDVTLPPSVGYSSVKTNNGSLSNKGVEIALNVYWFRDKSPFQWNTQFNFSKFETRIKELPDNGLERNRQGGYHIYDPASGQMVWAGGLQEGGRIGDLFALHYEGVYATDEEAALGPINTFIRVADKRSFGGDAKFRDMDQDGVINANDRYCVGNIYPNITGGFTNTLTYKGLTLNVRMDYTLGHTIQNYTSHFLNGQMQGDCMPLKSYYDRSWKKQGDQAEMPRYLYQDQQANLTSDNDIFYEKGDFLALREISLIYRLPDHWVSKLRMSNMQFKFTGYNLHYFTAYSGLNPEGGGQDQGRYPNPRTFTFGITASF